MPEENETVIGNIKAVSAGDDFGIKADDSPWATSFYFNDYYDDKAIKRFIKTTEKLIRTSKEYKTYIEELRTNVFALNHDNIMSNITTADVDLEFHHYPLSLYDIIETCMATHVARSEKFTSFSIAKEVMEEHYKHNIGLVPLTKTTHELAHSGNLLLKEKQIFGNYNKFISEHSDGISAEIMQKVDNMKQLSSINAPSDFKGLFK